MSYVKILFMNHSLPLNLLKSLVTSFKKNKYDQASHLLDVQCQDVIKWNEQKLKSYNKIVGWSKNEIHPLFPYALMTNLQFTLVNHPNFPFPPFGLIHKSEKIICHSPLKAGEWVMQMSVESITEVQRGYELVFKSELFIDGKSAWTSHTTTMKKIANFHSTKIFAPKPAREEIAIFEKARWNLPNGQGMQYGLISKNIDPIHISNVTAKLMGHKSAIMHGMWTVARSMSEYGQMKYPFELNVNFLSPIFLPATVIYSENGAQFSVHSIDKSKTHLTARFS